VEEFIFSANIKRRLAIEWAAEGDATMSAVTASRRDIVDTAPGAWI